MSDYSTEIVLECGRHKYVNESSYSSPFIPDMTSTPDKVWSRF